MLVFLGIQAFAGILVTLVKFLVSSDTLIGTSAMQTVWTMVVFALLTVIVFLLARWFKPSGEYLLSRPWIVIVWSIFAAIGAIVPSMWCQELLPAWPEWIQKIVDQTEQEFVLLMHTRGGYFVIALLAPVIEEMVFRGCVLSDLLRWRPERRWLMISLSALLFALSHLNPAQMPHAFVIGLLLGWIYSRTGSIVPGVVYHWANNTAAYLLFVAYPDPDIKLVNIFSGSERAVLSAVAFSLLILLPALYQLNRNMKTMKKADSHD